MLRPCRELVRPFLVKYGLREYLEPALREGRIRVSPASRYADPSLNPAIRDNELVAELDVGPFGMTAFGGLAGAAVPASSLRSRITKRIPRRRRSLTRWPRERAPSASSTERHLRRDRGGIRPLPRRVSLRPPDEDEPPRVRVCGT
jgi:hypothetical protein